MTREQTIAALANWAGSLGPFESLDEQLVRRDAWIAAAGPALIDTLLDILAQPPNEDEVRPATQENLAIELSDVLALVALRDPLVALQKLGPYLANAQARPTIIEVIGSLGLPQGISLLKPLVYDKALTEDVLVRVAGALGEIGGDQACSILREMRHSHSHNMVMLQREIDIALQSACSDFLNSS
jgi:hypothetical protein